LKTTFSNFPFAKTVSPSVICSQKRARKEFISEIALRLIVFKVDLFSRIFKVLILYEQGVNIESLESVTKALALILPQFLN